MKFNYVQIGSKNYRKLADFYIKVLDFKEVKKNEYLKNKEGVILTAPGFSDDNPIYFGIVKAEKGTNAKINDIGYAHTCYETVDVKACVKRLLKYGGSFQSTLKYPKLNPCVYCKDPEGNVVEFHIPFPSPDTKLFLTISSLLGLKHDKGIRKELGNSGIKFIHVNMISNDWTKLSSFYKNVFGATDFGKLKDHSGAYKEKVIGIKNVHVIGHHILLPNYYLSYPTFEVFTYLIKGRSEACDDDSLGINAIGLETTDLDKDIELIEKSGGNLIKKNDDLTVMSDIQGGIIYLKNACTANELT